MKKSNKGFTLVELIIVIAILAIIMLIAIPNFSGIQQRMQVRADKATAAQIGKAVRVWFTDYTTDKNLVEAAGDDAKVPSSLETPSTTVAGSVTTINYSDLAGIESYITKDYKASSLKDADSKAYTDADGKTGGYYTVFLTKNATDAGAKIAVAITSKDAATNISGVTTTAVTVNYDGKLSSTSNGGVAYVEP